MDFYSTLAPDYDRMTRFADRLAPEAEALRKWIDPARIRTALDTACGTGLHAILLAKMGVFVTGVDLSPEMIAKARVNAEAMGVNVNWLAGDMRGLHKKLCTTYDAILCLGNSLPHLLTAKELSATFRSFLQLLNPGGVLLLQQLNYDRILKTKNRIVGIHRKGETEFIRFYDFNGQYLNFNILTVTENQGKLGHTLASTRLYPYRKKELAGELKKQGFKRLIYAGSMDKQEFNIHESANLVIQAYKP